MCRRGEQGRRPVRKPLGVLLMKIIDGTAELLWLAAYLVQGSEAVIDIEGGVLYPFGRNRSGRLLKLKDKVGMRGARLLIEVLREFELKNVTQVVKDRLLDAGVTALCGGDRALDHSAIFFAHRLARSDISAVDRKTGNRLAHRDLKLLEREIAEPAVGLGKPGQHAAEDCDIVGQGQPCDQALLRIGEMAKMHGMTNEPPIGLGDRLLR